MIDVSHISDQAFEQVMEISQVAAIASHSSCRHFTPDWERNMSDDMIKKLAKKGGVIMINFGSSFIAEKARQERSKMWEAMEKFKTDNNVEHGDPRLKAFRTTYASKHDLPFATVEQVADHIDHVVKLTSIDHVGLGSDFDGVGDSLPVGLKDASQLPNLIAVLLARGYSEADIAKIGSGNVLRVWRAVEKHAAAQKN
jgi:membrane dipeptidase